jgi:hypothetical protein
MGSLHPVVCRSYRSLNNVRTKLLLAAATVILAMALAYWFYAASRIETWLEPDKKAAIRAAFESFADQRYDRSDRGLIVYLTCSDVPFDELISALPQAAAGVEFRRRETFKTPPGGRAEDWYFEQRTGRRVQFVSVSLGTLSLAKAHVQVTWAASTTGVEGWSYTLLRMPGRWIVVRTGSQALA